MKFTDSHEWILTENETGIVGITSHARKELGEVVYVQLPEVGTSVKAGEECVVLESTKAAADIYAPVSGKIVEVNKNVAEDPQLLNSSPEKDGWLIKISLSDQSELDSLLDHQQYLQLIEV